ncbi:hypothetical protein CIB48_g3643 [Xylaria polymorpha]|nr:hypothetical protein CIB48_g3643 [Xylaria polymorpha]
MQTRADATVPQGVEHANGYHPVTDIKMIIRNRSAYTPRRPSSTSDDENTIYTYYAVPDDRHYRLQTTAALIPHPCNPPPPPSLAQRGHVRRSKRLQWGAMMRYEAKGGDPANGSSTRRRSSNPSRRYIDFGAAEEDQARILPCGSVVHYLAK